MMKIIRKRIKQLYIVPIILFIGIILFFWVFDQVPNSIKTKSQNLVNLSARNNEPITPIPLEIPLNSQKVSLGDQLFHDTRLSANNEMSCASCHNLVTGGVDRLSHSIGIQGKQTLVNTPTVFNTGFQFRQFWDGRIANLEQQVEQPILAADEMGSSSWDQVINKLKLDPEYIAKFRKIYNDDITSDHIKNAIATYESSLYTPNSRFDQYLRGDNKALTDQEKRGYDLFKSYGCVSCHQGILLGGNMYQTFGLFGDYFSDRGNITKADLGRFNVTGNFNDRFMFKVPGLRNIVLTPPYFHDGSAKTLQEAIKIMSKYQLGRSIPDNDLDQILAFLNTLTGEYQGNPL